MSSEYFACTTRRLSLSVGVSSSLSAVHSTGSSRQRLTCCTRASCWLAAATASSISASTAGFWASSASEPASMPRALAQAGATSRVQGQQRDHVRTPVAVGQGLADQRVRDQQVLDRGGRHVLPARGDDELLLPVHHGQEAVVVQAADVPGVQPALGVDQLRGQVGPVQVAGRVERPPGEDLPVVRDHDLGARERPPHGAQPELGDGVGGERAGGLGHPVDVQDPQARARRRTRPPRAAAAPRRWTPRRAWPSPSSERIGPAPAHRPGGTPRPARPAWSGRTGCSPRTGGRRPWPARPRPAGPGRPRRPAGPGSRP